MFNEENTVKKPFLAKLEKLGYKRLGSSDIRNSENEYILDSVLLESLKRINGVDDVMAGKILVDVKNVQTNEEFFDRYKNGFSYKYGVKNRTNTYKLIDFENIDNNVFHYIDEFTFKSGGKEIRTDVTLFVNGIPFSVVELKTITTELSRDYRDAFTQIKRYERDAKNLFIPNCFSVIADENTSKYGATYSDLKYYSYFKDEDGNTNSDYFIESLLSKGMVCDIIRNFIVFEKIAGGTVKKVARYQQIRAVNKMVDLVLNGKQKRGLVWHTQGSGKTLTMLFAAQKIRFLPELRNPKVFIFVDRIELDNQMKDEFMNHGGENVIPVDSKQDLNKKIVGDDKGIFVTTVQKLSDGSETKKNDADNIILLVDEAHREKNKLGQVTATSESVERYFPNAKLFGFTGTPINKKETNTFRDYGSEGHPYLDKYSIKQAIDDESILNILFDRRLQNRYLIDKESIDYNFEEMTEGVTDSEKERVQKRAATWKLFFGDDERMQEIVKDVKYHYETFIKDNGFKAQFVSFDREIAVKYKKLFDKVFGDEKVVEIIYSQNPKDTGDLRKYYRSNQKNIIDKFKNKRNPPYILIVVDKLLTGFDAPIEKVIYLDRFLWDHKFLQAIARTNRIGEEGKRNGLVVDYCGVTHNLKEKLNFNEEDIEMVLKDIEEDKKEFLILLEETMGMFGNVDINNNSPEELDKHLRFLHKNEEMAEKFKKNVSKLNGGYLLIKHEEDVEKKKVELIWLTKMYKAYKNTYEPMSEEAEDLVVKSRSMIKEHITSITSKTSQVQNLLELLHESDEDISGGQKELVDSLNNLVNEVSVRVEYNPEFEKLSERLDKIRESIKSGDESNKEILSDIETVERELSEINKVGIDNNINTDEVDVYHSILHLLKDKGVKCNQKDILEFVKYVYQGVSNYLEKGWANTTLRLTVEKHINKAVDEAVLKKYKDIFIVKDNKELSELRKEIRVIVVKILSRI